MTGSHDVLRRLADLHDGEGIPSALAIQIACAVFVGITPRAREILLDAFTVGDEGEIRALETHLSYAAGMGSAAWVSNGLQN